MPYRQWSVDSLSRSQLLLVSIMHRARRVAARRPATGKVRCARGSETAVLIFQRGGGGGLSPAIQKIDACSVRPLPSSLLAASRIVCLIFTIPRGCFRFLSAAGSAFRAHVRSTPIHRHRAIYPLSITYGGDNVRCTRAVRHRNKNARFSLCGIDEAFVIRANRE